MSVPSLSPSQFKSLLAPFEEREHEAHIDAQIRAHRQGHLTVRVVDKDGEPAGPVRLCLRQNRHEFLFGANLFMLEGYEEAAQNRAYEQAFLELFNSAVVPFYWSDLEPEEGRPRFESDSPFIPRRPPPDRVLEFCDKHHLSTKGHCLVWHQWVPDWLPSDLAQSAKKIERRLREIAQRYGDRILRWDVVNEAMERFLFPQVKQLPPDYVRQSFRVAGQCFGPEAKLYLNEATAYSWREFHQQTTGLSLLLENLRLRGLRVDGLGLQYHLFFYDENGMSADPALLWEARDIYLNPARLTSILDHYSGFGLPIDISEITLPAYGANAVGEDFQARLLRALYRLWFSHPGVEAIHWWNLADGGSHGKESLLHGGLLREDLQRKPAYDMLRQLIREEWTTRVDEATDTQWSGRAFFGQYEVTVEHKGRAFTQTIDFSRAGSHTFDLCIEPQSASQSLTLSHQHV